MSRLLTLLLLYKNGYSAGEGRQVYQRGCPGELPEYRPFFHTVSFDATGGRGKASAIWQGKRHFLCQGLWQ